MEKNIKVFRVHRALFWFYSIISILFIIILSLPIFLWKNSNTPIPIELYYVLAFSILVSIVHLVVGKGAKNSAVWARNASFIVALFMLFAFPVGTIIGVYLLFNLGNWNTSSGNR